MKNFIKILILPIIIIIMFCIFSPKVFAVALPLSVQFIPDPLFSKPNFLPLDETSGIVSVTNNSGSTQTILTEANHVLDNEHFGDLLNIKITGTNGILFNNTLAYFFTTAGEYSLGVIESGETKTFTYTVSFIDSSDNSYQGKTLGFDVCVGFQGGSATNCGNTAIGNENGRGGSSSSSTVLFVWNEQTNDITNVNNFGSVNITWNTNKLSTSQVIYGLASGAPYNLDLNSLPNLGYPLGSVEDISKVTNHYVVLSGLIPGESYVYRVVSRASPATVSYEHRFTVPLVPQIERGHGLVLGADTQNDRNKGKVLGDSNEDRFKKEKSNSNENSNIVSNHFNRLGASVGSITEIPNFRFWIFIIILIILIFVIIIYRKRKNK